MRIVELRRITYLKSIYAQNKLDYLSYPYFLWTRAFNRVSYTRYDVSMKALVEHGCGYQLDPSALRPRTPFRLYRKHPDIALMIQIRLRIWRKSKSTSFRTGKKKFYYSFSITRKDIYINSFCNLFTSIPTLQKRLQIVGFSCNKSPC